MHCRKFASAIWTIFCGLSLCLTHNVWAQNPDIDDYYMQQTPDNLYADSATDNQESFSQYQLNRQSTQTQRALPNTPQRLILNNNTAENRSYNSNNIQNTQNNRIVSPFVSGGDDISFAPDGATMDNSGEAYYNGLSPRNVVPKNRVFKITPFIGADVTFSDNVNLTRDNRESGIIYGLNGGVRADIVTNRLDAAGTAAGSYFYNRDNGSEFAPFVEAGATAEIVRNHLFIDGLASYSTIFNNTESASSLTGANNNDLEGFGSFSLSPYWRQRIGNWAVGELRYGYDQAISSSDNIGDLTTHSYQGTIGTGDRFRRFSLQGTVAYADSDYDGGLAGGGNEGDLQQTTYQLSGAYGLTRTLSLIGDVGYDDVSGANVSDDTFTAPFFNAGLEYRPNSRARFLGKVGQRYNEINYLVEGNYNVTDRVYIGATAQTNLLPPSGFSNTTRNLPGNSSANIQNQINNGDSAAEAIRTVVGLQDGRIIGQTNDGLIVTGSDQNFDPYRSESAFLFAGFAGNKLNATLSGGFERRDFEFATDEDAYIANGLMSYQWADKWNSAIDVFYLSLKTNFSENESDTLGAYFTTTYAVNNNLSAFGRVGRLQRTAPVRNNEFEEHSATLGLSATF
ncbi:MAG: hypothetical protein AAF621_02415 [Pseudomonadota bacterium]